MAEDVWNGDYNICGCSCQHVLNSDSINVVASGLYERERGPTATPTARANISKLYDVLSLYSVYFN